MISSVEFAKALADDTRQEIMRLCCCSWMSVNEIVAAMHITQPTVSHHLSILKNAYLVKSRRVGKNIYYTINQENMATGCCTLAENFAPQHEFIHVQPEG